MLRPTRYREVVLTSWDRGLSVAVATQPLYREGGTDVMGPLLE